MVPSPGNVTIGLTLISYKLSCCNVLRFWARETTFNIWPLRTPAGENQGYEVLSVLDKHPATSGPISVEIRVSAVPATFNWFFLPYTKHVNSGEESPPVLVIFGIVGVSKSELVIPGTLNTPNAGDS